MKHLASARQAGLVVLLASYIGPLGAAESSEPPRLVNTWSFRNPTRDPFQLVVTKINVYRRGDTEFIGFVLVQNIPHSAAGDGSFEGPGTSIVLAKWKRREAELSWLSRLDGLSSMVNSMSVRDDGSCVFSQAGIDSNLVKRSSRSATAYHVLMESRDIVEVKAPKDVGTQAAVSPDGRLIAWGCRGGKVSIRSISSDRDLLTASLSGDDIRALRFSHDGEILAITTLPKPGPSRTQFLDLQSKRVIGVLANGENTAAGRGLFSFSGNAYAVAAMNSNAVFVKDFGSDLTTRFQGQNGLFSGAFVLFSDARLVISGGFSSEGSLGRSLGPNALPRLSSQYRLIGDVKIWDPLTNRVVGHIQERRLGGISSLAITSDDRFLFAGDSDGQIGAFDLEPIPVDPRRGR
jgi:WD40 repeat protein